MKNKYLYNAFLQKRRLWHKVALAAQVPLIGALLLGGTQLHAQEDTIPEIGNTFAQLSPQDEKLIGRAWLYRESSQLPILLEAPLLYHYIRQLSQDIVSFADLSQVDLNIVLLQDSSINAFAAPGGVIGINLGLLQAVDNEDELASVIAHEFAHLSQRHSLEVIASGKNRAPLTLGTLLAGLSIIASGNVSLGLATVYGGLGNEANATVDSIRANEEEADSIAFTTMQKAGRNPGAGLRLMEKLFRKNSDGSLPSVFRSHPLSSERITAIRHRSLALQAEASQPVDAAKRDPFIFYTAKILSGMYLAAQPSDYAKDLTENDSQHFGVSAKAYAFSRAIVSSTIGNHDQALAAFAPLYATQPLHQYIGAEYAMALCRAGDFPQAQRVLSPILDLNPGNTLVLTAQTTCLKKQRKNQEAIVLLERMAQQNPESLWLWNTLQVDYGREGKIAYSHYANGESNYLLGAHTNRHRPIYPCRAKKPRPAPKSTRTGADTRFRARTTYN